MEILALLLVFPLVWPLIAKAVFGRQYTLPEMGFNIVIVVACVCGLWFGGRYSQTVDHEVLNGQVNSKDSEHVSCSHDYQCNCYDVCSGSGSSRSCSRQCSTCYEHSYDVDWTLRTTVGDVDVPRIDRQGTSMPPRWASANVGDPVAVTHEHTNYIKGAPDSLFSAVAEQSTLAQFAGAVPEYPLDVYDLHYINRVLSHGVDVPDLQAWNKELAMRLRPLGASKQVNWVVVFTNSADPAYAEAVRIKWLGGKKNDVVVVLGTPQYPKLAWVRVLSWTDQELFKVQLRDDLLRLGTVDRTAVFDILEKNTKATFVRKHMRDFAYLKNEIQPPTWLLVVAGLVGVLGSLGLSFFFARNGVRSVPRGSYAYRRR